MSDQLGVIKQAVESGVKKLENGSSVLRKHSEEYETCVTAFLATWTGSAKNAFVKSHTNIFLAQDINDLANKLSDLASAVRKTMTGTLAADQTVGDEIKKLIK